MESTQVNEKVLKKTFKNMYKVAYPNGEKEIATDAAAQMVSEALSKVGREYSVEEATELLKQYDVDGNGMNTKKEVTNAVLVAAGLDVLDEHEIQKMKAKWLKKQEKIKNSTPEMKAKRKKAKHLFKGHMVLTLQEHNPSDSDQIPVETATTIISTVVEKMGESVDSEKVAEVISQLDSTGSGVLSEKECKSAVRHLVGMKTIDFAALSAKKAKRALKAQKKASQAE